MAEDYEELLSGSVDEVKAAVREMEDPDYDTILEKEREGDSRKTLTGWLENRTDSEDVESGAGEQSPEDDEVEVEEEVEELKEEEVEVSQDEGLSREKLLLVGGAVGLIAGLAAGMYLGGTGGGSPGVADSNMRAFLDSSGFNGSYSIDGPMDRNGMYFYNITLSQEGPNGTTSTRTQGAYVSTDGQLLFLQRQQSPFSPPNPIRIEQAIQRQQQAQQNATAQ